MTVWIVLGIIFIVLITLLWIPLGIGAKYENGTFILVKVAFFSFEIPLKKVLGNSKKKKKEDTEDKKPEKELEKGIIGLDFILSLFGGFRRFVRRGISLENFYINVKFGTADAASTAVSAGLLWTLTYNLLALVDKIMYVDNPSVSVEPVFNDATFSMKAGGIIQTTLAHIIATACIFAYKFLKYKIQKRRKFK